MAPVLTVVALSKRLAVHLLSWRGSRQPQFPASAAKRRATASRAHASFLNTDTTLPKMRTSLAITGVMAAFAGSRRTWSCSR